MLAWTGDGRDLLLGTRCLRGDNSVLNVDAGTGRTGYRAEFMVHGSYLNKAAIQQLSLTL